VPSIRDIRLATGHSQRSFAVLLGVPFETYRPLDSGRRPAPPALLQRAERVLDQHRRATELFTLDALADEFAIHPRTLRAAARDGRLRVQFSTRSVFGRPLRLASREAIDEFVRLHYRQRYSRYVTPLPRPHVTVVPTNCASRLIGLRLRLRLTQAELARRIGAASKAVIYQWETHRRTPSVVFWVRLEELAGRTRWPVPGDRSNHGATT
jgi:transcriptional regulator with XRE-family HTH domain